MKKGKLFVVSNAHLDTQWNWTVVDTIRDCVKNTMDYNFALFKKYPSYVMNFEGAFRYKLMKEYYPEKYKKVKKYVAEGRWNPVGAAWDAMDVNVPSGEALMRQVLYGNNFFEDEFGKITEDIFLPDCFGFRASLPSIMAHMGLTGFSTQKLVWGAGAPLLSPDGKVLPPMPKSDLPRLDLGKWRGPDGKEVFVSLLEGNYTYNFDNKGDNRPIGKRPEYLRDIEHNEKYSGVARRSMYFGTGDYGGSCSDGSARLIEEAVATQETNDFEVIPASPTDVYKGLTKKEEAALPVYEGGLLIPHGYGAMTSHTAMKRLNRYNEQLGDRAERASIAAKFFAGSAYPKKELTNAWKTFLWHQFHDDLTGTSIADAYVFSHNDLLLARNLFGSELRAALSAVEGKLDTRGKGTPYVVYNPSAFERSEVVEVPFTGKCAAAYEGSKRLPTAVTADGKAVFSAVLAPLSFTVIHVREEKHRVISCLKVGKTVLENEKLTVRLDRSGNVISVFDKTLDKELLKAPILFEIYGDNSTVWPSWEYTLKDLLKRPKTLTKSDSVEVIDCRPAYVAVKVRKSYGTGSFETVVKLESGSSRLVFENEVHWFERASNLFVRFPMTAESDYALFDGDPALIKGENTNTYPYFMHNVHTYAIQPDKSGKFGVLLSNDCKYGMIKPDDNTLCLALIHTPKTNFSPRSGQDWQDFGLNRFTFALEGFGESADAAKKGAEALNAPLSAVEASAHKGAVKSLSFLSLSGSGAMVTALKEEEKGDLVILRVRETEGKAQKKLKVTLPLCEIAELYECDGYERIGKALKHGEKEFSFDLEKFETKSFALKLTAKTVRVTKDQPIDLPQNCGLFIARGEKVKEKGVYLPKDLAEAKFTSAGVTFRTEGKRGTLTACAGQKIDLPEKKFLRIVAAAKKDAKEVSFTLDKTKVKVAVSPLNRPVGSIESVVAGQINFVNTDPVAAFYTHTYNEQGEDNLYDFAYFFTYELPIDGAKTLILPKDKDVLILAATATDKPFLPLSTPLYDTYESGESAPMHHLDAVGFDTGSGDYPAGALVLLYAPKVVGSSLFEGFEGEGIVRTDGCYVIIQIGDKDLTVKANYKSLGVNLLENKPCKANDEVHRGEAAAKAVDGNGYTKWCGNRDENGVCTLTVDMEEVKTVSSYLIVHAGDQESTLWNTSDFEILTKVKQSDEWVSADKVEDNKDSMTHRSFKPRKARFVMLKITKPARDGDSHARIYEFQMF